MATTKQDIKGWFDRGVKEKQAYLIVVCDDFDHSDYPVYIGPDDDFYESYDGHNGKNMQRIMEVYDLKLDCESQLNEHRAFHMPKRKEKL